jgi:hypothetical protein
VLPIAVTLVSRNLRYSLDVLLTSWTILLGVILWTSSLFLPIGARGDESYIGIQLLAGSVLTALARPRLLGKMVVVMSSVATALHVLLLLGLLLWILGHGRHVRFVSGISLVLISGAIAFETVRHAIFDATAIGFHLWTSGLICTGIGLFIDSIVVRKRATQSRMTNMPSG